MGRPTLAAVRARVVVAAVVAAVPVVVSGCSSAAVPSPPSGIDGLTIPDPDVRPGDFTADVTNPWLPLVVGSRWTYAASPRAADGTPPRDVTHVVVFAGPVVDGVDTVGVRSRTMLDPAGPRTDVIDYYAQDLAGNVWWFGHRITTSADVDDVEWEAGTGGAEPGLAMAAAPRLGDGYRTALVPQQLDAVADVKSVTGAAGTVAGDYADTVVIDVRDAVHDTSERSFYARGVGLVAEQDLDGGVQLTLSSYTPA